MKTFKEVLNENAVEDGKLIYNMIGEIQSNISHGNKNPDSIFKVVKTLYPTLPDMLIISQIKKELNII